MAIADQTTLSEEDKRPLKIAAIIALVLGVVALLSPFYAGIAATLVLAANFLIGGVLEAFAAFRAQRWSGTFGLMLLALVSIVAGLYIFAHPLLGLTTITLVCIAALLVSGIANAFWASRSQAAAGAGCCFSAASCRSSWRPCSTRASPSPPSGPSASLSASTSSSKAEPSWRS